MGLGYHFALIQFVLILRGCSLQNYKLYQGAQYIFTALSYCLCWIYLLHADMKVFVIYCFFIVRYLVSHSCLKSIQREHFMLSTHRIIFPVHRKCSKSGLKGKKANLSAKQQIWLWNFIKMLQVPGVKFLLIIPIQRYEVYTNLQRDPIKKSLSSEFHLSTRITERNQTERFECGFWEFKSLVFGHFVFFQQALVLAT